MPPRPIAVLVPALLSILVASLLAPAALAQETDAHDLFTKAWEVRPTMSEAASTQFQRYAAGDEDTLGAGAVEWLKASGDHLDALAAAAAADTCDWPLYGVDESIPELMPYRESGIALVARFRRRLAAGDLPGAVADARTLLGTSFLAGSTLIQALVAHAIRGVFLATLLDVASDTSPEARAALVPVLAGELDRTPGLEVALKGESRFMAGALKGVLDDIDGMLEDEERNRWQRVMRAEFDEYTRKLDCHLVGLADWMEARGYEDVDQVRGAMSHGRVAQPAAFERANYLRVLDSYQNRWG